jgi:hypothetical protein
MLEVIDATPSIAFIKPTVGFPTLFSLAILNIVLALPITGRAL